MDDASKKKNHKQSLDSPRDSNGGRGMKWCPSQEWESHVAAQESEHYYQINNILSAIEDGSLSVIATAWDKDKELHILAIEFPRTKLELEEEEHYQKMAEGEELERAWEERMELEHTWDEEK